MSFVFNGGTYFKTRREVERARREGEVVYFSNVVNAYYLKNQAIISLPKKEGGMNFVSRFLQWWDFMEWRSKKQKESRKKVNEWHKQKNKEEFEEYLKEKKLKP